MTRNELLESHKALCTRAWKIMELKSHDYAGPGEDRPFINFEAIEAMEICSAELWLVGEIVKKLRRLITFAKAGKLLVAESAEDSIIDIINYAVIFAAMGKDSE